MKFVVKSILLITVAFLLASKSLSGTIPGFDKSVSIKAVEQPIAPFLQELFGQLDLAVLVDSSIDGKISGVYREREAREVFSEVARSFGLTAYFDGAVVYIYRSSDMKQKILAVPSRVARRVIRSASDLGMIDEKNYLQSARNGGLVISGTERFIDQVEELVLAAQKNMDEYKTPLSFRVFYLKYAWAQDVNFDFSGRKVQIPGVASIVSFLAEDGKNTRFPSSVASSFSGTTELSLGDRQPLSNAGNRIGGYLGMKEGEPNRYFGYSERAGYERGDVRISVDPRLNAVIVRDSPERMPYYESLINALDIEPQMVEVEATIIDVNTSKLREMGINWRGANDGYEALFGRGDSSDLRLQSGANITPSGEGGYLSFILGDRDQFVGRIQMLEKQGAAKVVSSPHVLTLSNVEAIFDTSSTFYVRVEGYESVDLFSISVGTSLRVTPHVFKDGGQSKMKLLVTIEDGNQEDQQVDDIPVVTRSVINTQALLEPEESVLIGGLVREATFDGKTKVPLLGDIPVLGQAFQFKQKKNERVERMFLISPRLSTRRLNQKTLDELQEEPDDADLDISYYYETTKRRMPKYPRTAKKRGIEGYCIVHYSILTSGETANVEATDCSHDVFARESEKAVEGYQYTARLGPEDMVEISNARAKIVYNLEKG